jgi:hypothetical protein
MSLLVDDTKMANLFREPFTGFGPRYSSNSNVVQAPGAHSFS